MNEIDKIVSDQLLLTRRRLKVVNKLLRLMPKDPWLLEGKQKIEKNILWLESLIENEKLKKRKYINIKRTFTNIVYAVRFMYFLKILLQKDKNEKNNKKP